MPSASVTARIDETSPNSSVVTPLVIPMPTMLENRGAGSVLQSHTMPAAGLGSGGETSVASVVVSSLIKLEAIHSGLGAMQCPRARE